MNAVTDQKIDLCKAWWRAIKGLVCFLLQLAEELVKEIVLFGDVQVFSRVKLEDLPNQKTWWHRRKSRSSEPFKNSICNFFM